MSQFSKGLLEHLRSSVLPKYECEGTGHGTRHIEAVMSAVSRILEPGIDPNLGLGDIALLAAAYHDISLALGGLRDKHEIESAYILRGDADDFAEWLPPTEIEAAATAIETHRASGSIFPASYPACVLYDADRASNADLAVLVERTWAKRRLQHPEWGREETLADMSAHLVEKFGPGGYGRRLILARTEAIYGLVFRQIEARVGDVGELDALLRTLQMTGRVAA